MFSASNLPFAGTGLFPCYLHLPVCVLKDWVKHTLNIHHAGNVGTTWWRATSGSSGKLGCGTIKLEGHECVTTSTANCLSGLFLASSSDLASVPSGGWPPRGGAGTLESMGTAPTLWAPGTVAGKLFRKACRRCWRRAQTRPGRGGSSRTRPLMRSPWWLNTRRSSPAMRSQAEEFCRAAGAVRATNRPGEVRGQGNRRHFSSRFLLTPVALGSFFQVHTRTYHESSSTTVELVPPPHSRSLPVGGDLFLFDRRDKYQFRRDGGRWERRGTAARQGAFKESRLAKPGGSPLAPGCRPSQCGQPEVAYSIT